MASMSSLAVKQPEHQRSGHTCTNDNDFVVGFRHLHSKITVLVTVASVGCIMSYTYLATAASILSDSPYSVLRL